MADPENVTVVPAATLWPLAGERIVVIGAVSVPVLPPYSFFAPAMSSLSSVRCFCEHVP